MLKLENKQKYNVYNAVKLTDGNVGNAKCILTIPLYMAFCKYGLYSYRSFLAYYLLGLLYKGD